MAKRRRALRDSVRGRVIELRTEGYSFEVIARMAFVSYWLVRTIITELPDDPLRDRIQPPACLPMGRVHRIKRRPDPAPWQRIEAIRLRGLGWSFRSIARRLEISESDVRGIFRRLGKDPIVRPVWKGSLSDFLGAEH